MPRQLESYHVSGNVLFFGWNKVKRPAADVVQDQKVGEGGKENPSHRDYFVTQKLMIYKY